MEQLDTIISTVDGLFCFNPPFFTLEILFTHPILSSVPPPLP